MQSLAARQQYFQETSHRFVHYWSNYVQTHQHEFNHLEQEIENILAALGIVKSTDTSYPTIVLGIYDYFEFRGFLESFSHGRHLSASESKLPVIHDS